MPEMEKNRYLLRSPNNGAHHYPGARTYTIKHRWNAETVRGTPLKRL